MDKSNSVSRKLFFWIFFWFLLLAVCLVSYKIWDKPVNNYVDKYITDYFGKTENQSLPSGNKTESQPATAKEKNRAEALKQTIHEYDLVSYGVLAASLFVTAFFMWLCLIISVKRMIKKARTLPALQSAPQSAPRPIPPAPKKKDEKPVMKEEKPVKKDEKPIKRDEKPLMKQLMKPALQEMKRNIDDDWRRSLQILSLLQREGRFVDFLNEDLENYDDSQIGAAVRSIHENCRQVLNKCVTLVSVINQEEGEEVTVPPGFDAGSINLTGNIPNQPPFRGILQHRGWRVSRLELPSLSGTTDPGIIAPAEVEI
ncbi:MAG: DUF2760 domain-containing protein [Deltaproteobacteria bacterium]|nr:DUF2760 domain-containing protein [Deltaproteobacteria bacterium]